MCSGIGAPEVAFSQLGWECVFAAEIDRFARAVYATRFPDVLLYGDFTKITEEQIGRAGAVDVLVAGTPCQGFSIAGLRGGLHGDDRSNLALAFLLLVGRLRPRYILWENVPGALSSRSHAAPDLGEAPDDLQAGEEREVVDHYEADEYADFECFLAGLRELGYGFAYRVLDAQYFGVPQRRRRVFVVGCIDGAWQRAGAILFDGVSLSGDFTPRRKAGEIVTALTSSGAGVGGVDDNVARAGHLVGALQGASPEGGHRVGVDEVAAGHVVAAPITSSYGKQVDSSERNGGPPNVLAAPLTKDAYADRAAEESNLIVFDPNQVTSAANRSQPSPGKPCHALPAHDPPLVAFSNTSGDTALGTGAEAPPITARHGDPGMVAFSYKDDGSDSGETSPTLRAMAFDQSHANAGGSPAVAFQCHGTNVGEMGALRGGNGNEAGGVPFTGDRWGVRRFTPVECERLMNFPDDFTLVPYRGKESADGNRYRALGNSMVVSVLLWLGQRIDLVESLLV